MYFVQQGTLSVVSSDGGETILNVLHAGSYFGEVSLLYSGTRTAGVRADTYCELMKLDKEDFQVRCAHQPHLHVAPPSHHHLAPFAGNPVALPAVGGGGAQDRRNANQGVEQTRAGEDAGPRALVR